MSPKLSRDDALNGGLADSIDVSEHGRFQTDFAAVTDAGHVLFGQFSKGRILASWPLRPALCVAIMHIVAVCPEKKMIRVNARTVVAAVQNMLANRDRTTKHFPSGPVRANGLLPKAEVSVTAILNHPRPQPTSAVGLGNKPSLKGREAELLR